MAAETRRTGLANLEERGTGKPPRSSFMVLEALTLVCWILVCFVLNCGKTLVLQIEGNGNPITASSVRLNLMTKSTGEEQHQARFWSD